MASPTTTRFSKQATCPSADELLSFNAAGQAVRQDTRISSHLAECEFCAAEFQLLSSHASTEVLSYKVAEIPAHLRHLAEMLLRGNHESAPGAVSGTKDQNERLTLTDA